MVAHLFFVFLLLPFLLLSGDFTASVSQNTIQVGETFSLLLTLRDASAQDTPSIAPLQQSFLIHSQQQSSNTIIKNGMMTVSNTWKYILIPQREGEVVIPSISIATTEGNLTTEPVSIHVVKQTARPSASDSLGLLLTTELSNPKPYKNEPFLYTAKLYSKSNLANLQMQKIEMENAIFEPNGEPKIYEQKINNIRVATVEYSYLITPLKDGAMKIPPMTMQGSVSVKAKDGYGSLFDDDLGGFSMFGFSRLQPFALTTEEITIDVQAQPIGNEESWLPAKSLKLEEIWDEAQIMRVGEPLTRRFHVFAEGIQSNQLPNIGDALATDDSVRSYADKPELHDEIQGSLVKSYRKEQHTLIPQKAGTVVLPEIVITWWDIAKKERAFSRIPSRTLQIESALHEPQSLRESYPEGAMNQQELSAAPNNPLLYILLGGLTLFLFAAIFWVFALQKKIAHLTEAAVEPQGTVTNEKMSNRSVDKPSGMKRFNKKREKLPDLNPT